MFATSPDFAMPTSHEAVDEGWQFWEAVSLPHESSWFLFTFYVGGADGRGPQTLMAASAQTLVQVVEAVPEEDRYAIAHVSKDERKGAGWTVQWLDELCASLPSVGKRAVYLRYQGQSEMRVAEAGFVVPTDQLPMLFKWREPVALAPSP